MNGLALVQDKVIPLEAGFVPVDDNGYLLGDGVFETMRTTHTGKLFKPDLHIRRFLYGLEKLLITSEYAEEQFINAAEKLRSEATKQLGKDLYIRINASTGSNQNWSVNQSLVLTGIAKVLPEANMQSIHCETWQHHGQSHELSDVKSLSYVRSTLLRRKVSQINADEIIVISPDSTVVEASMSNLIARKNNVLYAPGKAAGALPGVTRRIILEQLIDQTKYQIEEQLPLNVLYECDEVLLTSIISGVRNVHQIDDRSYESTELYDQLFADFEALLG